MKYSKETKIGSIFIIGAVLLIWGYNFLKGQDILTQNRTFYAVYQKVSGLGKANPVYINGMQVGQITQMYFDPSMNGNIIIGLTINKDFPIPKNSIAEILSTDIMGTKAVNIDLGLSSELAQHGDTLTSKLGVSLTQQVEATVGPLKRKAESLITNIDEIITNLNAVLSHDQVNSLKGSITHLHSSLENADTLIDGITGFVIDQQSSAKAIMFNLESITNNIQGNNEKLSSIMSNFETISDTIVASDLAGTLLSVNKSMADFSQILEKLNKGDGSVGQLLNNKNLYLELEKSSRDLNLLLEDIRLHPKKYVKFSLF